MAVPRNVVAPRTRLPLQKAASLVSQRVVRQLEGGRQGLEDLRAQVQGNKILLQDLVSQVNSLKEQEVRLRAEVAEEKKAWREEVRGLKAKWEQEALAHQQGLRDFVFQEGQALKEEVQTLKQNLCDSAKALPEDSGCKSQGKEPVPGPHVVEAKAETEKKASGPGALAAWQRRSQARAMNGHVNEDAEEGNCRAATEEPLSPSPPGGWRAELRELRASVGLVQQEVQAVKTQGLEDITRLEAQGKMWWDGLQEALADLKGKDHNRVQRIYKSMEDLEARIVTRQELKSATCTLAMGVDFDLTSVDFSNYGKGDRWDSRPFSLGGVQGFRFSIYPKGCAYASHNFCSLFLYHLAGGFTASFRLTLDDTSKTASGLHSLESGMGLLNFAPAASAFRSAKVELLDFKRSRLHA